MEQLSAPTPARGPWLTAVLNTAGSGRPVAVVVEPAPGAPPAAAAFLTLRRRGLRTGVTLLGNGVGPVPAGRPPARLLAVDDTAAEQLAGGILDLLQRIRGPWTTCLAGLPLGDPTSRVLAASLPTAGLATLRSTALVDALAEVGQVERSRTPQDLERWLPALLDRLPDRRSRGFLRAAARLHTAVDRLEVAVVAEGPRLRAALLTLVEGADRWPWWGSSDVGGIGTGMGAPSVTLAVPGGPGVSANPLRRPPVRRRTAQPG